MGHAMALMEDYRPYLPADLREGFDEFLKLYNERGRGWRTFDRPTLSARCDPEVVEQWMDEVFNRLDGNHNPDRRLAELEREGIVGEVLFPDFGLPFELLPPSQSCCRKMRDCPGVRPNRSRPGHRRARQNQPLHPVLTAPGGAAPCTRRNRAGPA